LKQIRLILVMGEYAAPHSAQSLTICDFKFGELTHDHAVRLRFIELELWEPLTG
jgi:hypothetical protein